MRNAFYSRLYSSYRKHGAINLARVLGIRIWRNLFQSAEYIFVILCNDLVENTEGNLQDLEVKLYLAIEDLPEKDLEIWSMHKEGMQPVLAFLEKFFSRGAVLRIFYKQGAMVGYMWSAKKGLNGFHFFPLLDNEAVLYAAEVFPEFRGKGVWPIMIDLTAQGLGREGIERVYLGCKVWNHSSYRGITKTSAIELGRVSEIRMRGRAIVVWRDVESSAQKKRRKDLHEAI